MPTGSAISETTFRSLEAAVVATEAHPAAESGPARIIVFNDHPVFRSALSWKLGRDSGIRVIADAASLYETLSLLGGLFKGSVDAVIADLRVGDGNSEGINSVRTLVDRLVDVPVVVCSDLYSRSYATRMSEVGAAAMVQKSAAITRLAAAILEAVSRSRPEPASPGRTNGITAA